MTISSNLKTRVQAKISAVNGSTTLTELLKLKKAAEGLGCDETALETQLQARLTAMGASTESTDLLVGSKTSGLAGRSYYTVPFAVNAGDALYVDQLGAIRKRPHTIESALRENVGGSWNSPLMVHNCFRQGYVGNFWLSYALQNGNTLVMHGGSTQGIAVYFVFSPELRVLAHGSISIAGVTQTGSDYYLGCFEVTPNTFRLYMVTSNTAGDSDAAINYRTFSYNTGSHAVTAGSATTVLDDGFIFYADLSLGKAQRKTARYVPVQAKSGVNSRFYILDLQTGTLIRYTALDNSAGATYGVLDVDQFSSGNEYAIVRSSASGGTVRVCKIGSDVSAAVPASVSSIFTGASHVYRCIAQGVWIAVPTVGNSQFLVKFSADYTTATIFNIMGTTPPVDLDSPAATNVMVFTDGSRYWLHTGANRPVISFLWDGVSVLKAGTLETGFSGTDRAALNAQGVQLISASDQFIYSARFSFLTASYGFIRFSPAELFPHAITQFGICLGDAASGQVVEIGLAEDSASVPSMPAANMIGYRHHQGILTKLAVRGPFVKLHAARASTLQSSRAESSDYPRLIQETLGKGYAVSGSFVAKTAYKTKTMFRGSQGPDEDFILQWLGVQGFASFADFGDDGSASYGIAAHLSNHAPMMIYNSLTNNTVSEEKL